ncbi:hypothetical protein Dacet_2669 [Denitrovibrio acetiphilus DSM 12809]|uniref:Uncharacterized protein n=1 Tax=Denitrovibrio acetiphilus (strain DSM 12809 / NBRC 114555 / N2460) TaxID=522772 RepID=D4H570_DENA2|nr:hypothetical protein [Denitrovibrio acetiphilus]ADD69426.1 hypothetical protein Dacet_2669 [Denitrovibrio acetiphilus DSM 12809]
MQELVTKRIMEALDFIQCPLPLAKENYDELLPAIIYWLHESFDDDELDDISIEYVASLYEHFTSIEVGKTLNKSDQNILIGFHIDACQHEAYQYYAYEIHHKLVDFDKQYPNNIHQRFYNASLAARVFVASADAYLQRTGKVINIHEIIFSDMLDTIVEQDEKHIERFDKIMHDAWEEGNSYTRICGKRIRKFFRIKSHGGDNSYLQILSASHSQVEVSADNSVRNYIVPAWTYCPTSEVKKYFYEKTTQFVRQSRVVSIYDYDVVQLHEMKKLLDDYQRRQHPITALLILSALSGVDVDDWSKILRGNKYRSIKLSEDKDYYWFHLHKVGYHSKSFKSMSRYSQNTRLKVKVVLPAFLCELVQSIELPERLSLNDIKEHINAFNHINYTHITPARIRKFFRAFASDVCGQNDLTIAYISNTFAETSFTQTFYTRISAEYIGNRFADVVSELLHRLGFTELTMLPEQACVYNENYGSRAVPEVETMQYIFKNIRELYYSEIKLKEKLNILSFYTYIGLQLTSSLRRIASESKSLIASDFSHVILRDKDSQRKQEHRIVDLCDDIKEQFRILKRYRETVSIAGYITPVYEYFELTDLLYHLGHKDKLGYYDKGTVESRYLSRIGIERNCIVMNFCRHFLRTNLMQKNFDYEIANYWLGHVTDGIELNNIFSFADMPEVQLEIITMQSKLLAECGYEVIK